MAARDSFNAMFYGGHVPFPYGSPSATTHELTTVNPSLS